MKDLTDIAGLTVAVIGGGNVGTQFACVCASKGSEVRIYTSRCSEFADTLELVDEFGHVTRGTIKLATDDISEALRGADVIFVTTPAFMLEDIAEKMLPHIEKDQVIVVLPGTGGAEFAFHDCLRKGAILSGVQRVPAVARLEGYGRRVRCEGLRKEMFLASVPRRYAADISELISDLFGIPCTPLPNYLCVTLTPSNPILHTTRLRTLFKDYREGVTYDRIPKFYGEWSDESAELLLKCDRELQDMIALMDQADLSSVKSLKIHYESDDVPSLTNKLRSIESLHALPTPMVKVAGGYIPDFDSRYFKADFPYGLAILESFAEVLDYDATNIKETMDWYIKMTGDCRSLSLEEHDITTVQDIYDFYHC